MANEKIKAEYLKGIAKAIKHLQTYSIVSVTPITKRSDFIYGFDIEGRASWCTQPKIVERFKIRLTKEEAQVIEQTYHGEEQIVPPIFPAFSTNDGQKLRPYEAFLRTDEVLVTGKATELIRLIEKSVSNVQLRKEREKLKAAILASGKQTDFDCAYHYISHVDSECLEHDEIHFKYHISAWVTKQLQKIY